jgi:hypothetical protein
MRIYSKVYFRFMVCYEKTKETKQGQTREGNVQGEGASPRDPQD